MRWHRSAIWSHTIATCKCTFEFHLKRAPRRCSFLKLPFRRRFYPTGQVISLLTNEGETPQQSIHKLNLNTREKVRSRPSSSTRLTHSHFFDPQCLSIGTWRLSGTTVYITDLLDVLAGDASKYMFQMTLELRSRPLGRWNRLSMQLYETVAIADGEAIALPLKNERPFWFSKVRSYGL